MSRKKGPKSEFLLAVHLHRYFLPMCGLCGFFFLSLVFGIITRIGVKQQARKGNASIAEAEALLFVFKSFAYTPLNSIYPNEILQ
jgi:hypothetical protein